MLRWKFCLHSIFFWSSNLTLFREDSKNLTQMLAVYNRRSLGKPFPSLPTSSLAISIGWVILEILLDLIYRTASREAGGRINLKWKPNEEREKNSMLGECIQNQMVFLFTRSETRQQDKPRDRVLSQNLALRDALQKQTCMVQNILI